MTLLRNAVVDQRRTVLGWSVGWALLVALYAVTWPAVRDSAADYQRLVEALPEGLRGVLGPGEIGTGAGYVQLELFSVTGPLLVVVLGVLLGHRVVGAPEDDGLLELLLAQPITRTRVLLERWGAAVLVLTATCAALAVALLVASPLVDLGLSPGRVLSACLLLSLLGTLFLTATVLVGAVGGAGRAVAATLAVGLYLLPVLAGATSALSGLASWSPFHRVVQSAPLEQGAGPGLLLLLALPTALLLPLAATAFRSRDLHV